MATSREQRMQERMRGAGRHEVADDSFGFDLPGAPIESPEAPAAPEPEPEPAPAAVPSPRPPSRSEPNTSVKRHPINIAALQNSPPQPDDAERIEPPDPSPAQSSQTSTRRRSPRIAEANTPSADTSPAAAHHDQFGSPDLSAVKPAAPVPESPLEQNVLNTSIGSAGGPMTEEVSESPAAAPGSGHRRRVPLDHAATQSSKLQRLVMEIDPESTGDAAMTSSPLAQKTRRSGGVTASRSNRPSQASQARSKSTSPVPSPDQVDEPPPPSRPGRPRQAKPSPQPEARPNQDTSRQEEVDELSPTTSRTNRPGRPSQAKSQAKPKPQPNASRRELPQEDVDELSPPQVRTTNTAPKRKEPIARGKRKRPPSPGTEPRPTREATSPEETHAEPREAEIPAKDVPRVPSKRNRGNAEPTAPEEPIRKKQQKKQPSPPQRLQTKPPKPKSKPRKSMKRRSEGGEAIPITVQRYTQHMTEEGQDSDDDILQADIPFSNRTGVNVIDVLSQICDEVLDSFQEKLFEAANQAETSAIRKEHRTKLRALEAFQEELRTRLLEHTIALDSLHALQKRIRSLQKEKVTLRTEIMRIRSEREEVALKKDSVRLRHESGQNEMLRRLELSSMMHDIELAVENGKAAPEPSAAELKTASLANLEVLVSRVAEQAGVGGGGAGSLKQIQDFNAMLERAATALQVR